MRWLCPTLLLSFSVTLAAQEPVTQLAFASCFNQAKTAPALEALADLEPDVFIWMGDNVYGDTEDMEVLREKYSAVKAVPAYQRLAKQAEIVGTWDDHDYGRNDAGKEYPKRAESQKVLLDFLGVPADSPRRRREGVYASHDFGPEGRQVRVILLDTRYHRDALGSNGTILGEDQWQWLEKTLLKSPAEVNVLVSSIQVLAAEHRWEKWSNFPKEQARLFNLLARPEAPPVVILTGDRHLAEISLEPSRTGYPLFDVTSSSLNRPLGGSPDELNVRRVGRNFRAANFGTLSIDWSGELPVITACIRDHTGIPQRAVSFELSRKAN